MSNKGDSLGDRMKKYENITRTHLTPRTPVIIRLDGRAFHTFTRGFMKPFDRIFVQSMQETMRFLCENIQGCVLGYTQSDEITLVLVDYQNLDSNAWFDNNIQKITSVSASMATLAFNRIFQSMMYSTKIAESEFELYKREGESIQDAIRRYFEKLNTAANFGAMFDSRCFNLPKEEVTNCLLWRQNDATRNSIEAMGQAYFSASRLHGKTCSMIQDMLMTEKGINWNDLPVTLKRGCCCIRVKRTIEVNGEQIERAAWEIDNDIPIFKGEVGRDYINRLVYVGG